ncbi:MULTISPECIES: FecR domain-containing protein [Oxalobacteraceae]|uniref:FecR family protein n=1 Tax=Herminiimonas sp. Marseille-P9896 TaxID=2742211 RepID=UPI0020CA9659|nr:MULTISPECIES: FecR domain-containing protein [Oxalobacteraceae]
MNKKTMTADDMAIQREAQAWVVRLDSRAVSEDDAQAFRLWCTQNRAHATAFSEARNVWSAMRPAAMQVKYAEARRQDAVAGAHKGRRAFLGGAVAASVAYLAFRPPMDLWPSLGEVAAGFAADYQTATGEQRTLAMNDSVFVQMNTQTRLNVQVNTNSETGMELLSGEAEIQTDFNMPGKVTVLAGGGVVSALQARFNIRYTGNKVCVTCLQGRVQVGQAIHRATLDAGQQLTYRDGDFGVPQAANTSSVTAWRKRMLVFNQVALSEVVTEVNRYRPGKLILRSEELGRSKVQASFSIDRLDDVIALIRDAYGADVTQLPGGIVLLRKATA